jgi:hypothetical protein
LLGTHLQSAEQKGPSFLQEQRLFLQPDLQEQPPQLDRFFFGSSFNIETFISQSMSIKGYLKLLVCTDQKRMEKSAFKVFDFLFNLLFLF